jgi:nucleoside-diphosphate-sugar epimerase
MRKLSAAGFLIHAISRNAAPKSYELSSAWGEVDLAGTGRLPEFNAEVLFHVASIWLLPKWVEEFHERGVRRIVAFSSTSRFSKAASSSMAERAVAESLVRSEDAVANACERLGIAYTIFRPTLTYGSGRDRNVGDIARFERRFGIFPILGKGTGLRQPVHAADLAEACLQTVDVPASFGRMYNLSGGETLSYRQMVERVFEAMGQRPRILAVPEWVFRPAIEMARRLPKYRHMTPEMARRMDIDLCCDHDDATRDFGYAPRGFHPDGRALGLGQ